MKKILILCMALILAGCTANIRMTEINLDAGHDMKVDASGASSLTETDQTSSGDWADILDSAKQWLDGNMGKVLDSIETGKDIVIPVVPKEETFTPAPPEQGEFKELQ